MVPPQTKEDYGRTDKAMGATFRLADASSPAGDVRVTRLRNKSPRQNPAPLKALASLASGARLQTYRPEHSLQFRIVPCVQVGRALALEGGQS